MPGLGVSGTACGEPEQAGSTQDTTAARARRLGTARVTSDGTIPRTSIARSPGGVDCADDRDPARIELLTRLARFFEDALR